MIILGVGASRGVSTAIVVYHRRRCLYRNCTVPDSVFEVFLFLNLVPVCYVP